MRRRPTVLVNTNNILLYDHATPKDVCKYDLCISDFEQCVFRYSQTFVSSNKYPQQKFRSCHYFLVSN